MKFFAKGFQKEGFFWIGICIILVIVIVILFLYNADYKSKLVDGQGELKSLSKRIEHFKKELVQLDMQYEGSPPLSGSDIKMLEEKGLKNPVEDIINDLKKHSGLIPLEAVLGGTMQFNMVRIITDKWVLASFEDGHIGGYMLLEYDVSSGGYITWKPITWRRY